MNATMTHRPWRTAAAVAIGAVMALTIAVPASAAVDPATIDPDAKASLTIHKLEYPGAANTSVANGLVNTSAADLTAIDGVEFDLHRVGGVDLSTNAGWTLANTLSASLRTSSPAAVFIGDHALTKVDDGETADGDPLVFEDLAIGLYLVTETSTPAGITPAKPFLVSLPMTHPVELDTWVYDVHVYPKNAKSGLEKSIDDEDAVGFGDVIEWTIEGDIPAIDDIGAYRVKDTLSPKLKYESVTVSLSGSPVVALDTQTDYEVTVPTEAARTLTVSFTPEGIAKLQDNRDRKVVVVITTTVLEVGEILNDAQLCMSEDCVEADPVVTKWGGITITKTDAGTTPLTGAEFSVYTSEADALAKTHPVEIDGKTVFTGEIVGGEVTNTIVIKGLRYSNWANGAPVDQNDDGFIQYYLVEVKAPAGFVLAPDPIPFQITADMLDVSSNITVKNMPLIELPLTGGVGTSVVYLGGTLVLLGAVLLYIRARSRSKMQH